MLAFTCHRQNSARRRVNSLAHKVNLLVMLCAVFCSVDALAAWGEKNVQRESRVTQVSVQDGMSNNLGVFAGVVPVKAGAELFKSAYLVVSPQGYILPVFADGKVAVVEPLYFQSRDCSGAEYVRASSRQPVFTALPGAVFRQAFDEILVYVPAGSPRLAMTMRSFIDRENQPVCTSSELAGLFYKIKVNNEEITGHKRTLFPEPISLFSADTGRGKMKTSRQQRGPADPAEVAAETMDYQEECSPGCLLEDINNGVCDIACWAAACDYDSGDCDTLPASELDEKLRSICSPGCFAEDVNDGFCDAFCNVELCNFDGGDCVD